MIILQNLKYSLKSILSSIIYIFGPHRWFFIKPKLVILTYHRVLPENHPDLRFQQPGMYVHPKTFEMHLESIVKYFTPVSLGDWLYKAANNQPLPRRAVAVTFDDGWIDNYEYAFPLLKAKHIPASMYLVSSMIGSNQYFWPEDLGRSLLAIESLNRDVESPELDWLRSLRNEVTNKIGSPLTVDQIDQIVCLAKSRHTDTEIKRHLINLRKLFETQKTTDSDRCMLNWDQCRNMLESGLVTFGSHTCDHIRLNDQISASEIKQQLELSKQKIEGELNTSCEIFCYPNGDTSANAESAVKERFYAALTTARGWNGKHTSKYELKRISLHEDASNSPVRFLTRVSGLI